MSTTIRPVPHRRPLASRIRMLISANVDGFRPGPASRLAPGSPR